MTHYVLHIAACPERRQSTPWPADAAPRGVSVLRAASLREGTCCARAYRLMLVLLDLEEAGEETLATIRELADASCDGRPAPVIGLALKEFSPDEQEALAEAGLADCLPLSAPPRFIQWRLETLVMLEGLRQFEQMRTDVTSLAGRTRTHLHDLSQPLSAIQGRLQLMAARCPADDPHAQTFQELVRLAFSITHQVMELQQLHRQF